LRPETTNSSSVYLRAQLAQRYDLRPSRISEALVSAEAVVVTCGWAGPTDEALLRASEAIDSPIKLGDDCQTYSDHQHFWTAGLPAVLMIDSTETYYYPWYHEAGDTMDKVNVPYLRSMIQLNAAAESGS
jgi:hypothetical protein